jgi:hypothetical protein
VEVVVVFPVVVVLLLEVMSQTPLAPLELSVAVVALVVLLLLVIFLLLLVQAVEVE